MKIRNILVLFFEENYTVSSRITTKTKTTQMARRERQEEIVFWSFSWEHQNFHEKMRNNNIKILSNTQKIPVKSRTLFNKLHSCSWYANVMDVSSLPRSHAAAFFVFPLISLVVKTCKSNQWRVFQEKDVGSRRKKGCRLFDLAVGCWWFSLRLAPIYCCNFLVIMDFPVFFPSACLRLCQNLC